MFLRRDPSILKIFRGALIEVYGKIDGEKLFQYGLMKNVSVEMK
jgi:hypothetical protein